MNSCKRFLAGALLLTVGVVFGCSTAFAQSGRVRTQYLAQSLEQMRDGARLTLASPPEQQDILVPGCPRESQVTGCPLSVVEKALQQAIDPHATSISGLVSEQR